MIHFDYLDMSRNDNKIIANNRKKVLLFTFLQPKTPIIQWFWDMGGMFTFWNGSTIYGKHLSDVFTPHLKNSKITSK